MCCEVKIDEKEEEEEEGGGRRGRGGVLVEGGTCEGRK